MIHAADIYNDGLTCTCGAGGAGERLIGVCFALIEESIAKWRFDGRYWRIRGDYGERFRNGRGITRQISQRGCQCIAAVCQTGQRARRNVG